MAAARTSAAFSIPPRRWFARGRHRTKIPTAPRWRRCTSRAGHESADSWSTSRLRVDRGTQSREPAAVERIPNPLASTLAAHEPRLAEKFHVVRDGRLTLADRDNEIADTDFPGGVLADQVEQAETHRVGERCETEGQLVGVFVSERVGKQRHATPVGRGRQHSISSSHVSPIDILRYIDDDRRIDSCRW
jgi:hypothetical protein